MAGKEKVRIPRVGDSRRWQILIIVTTPTVVQTILNTAVEVYDSMQVARNKLFTNNFVRIMAFYVHPNFYGAGSTPATPTPRRGAP